MSKQGEPSGPTNALPQNLNLNLCPEQGELCYNFSASHFGIIFENQNLEISSQTRKFLDPKFLFQDAIFFDPKGLYLSLLDDADSLKPLSEVTDCHFYAVWLKLFLFATQPTARATTV